MKKLYSFIALLAAVITFTACGDDDATFTATPKLELSNVNVLFEPEGGTGSITVNTTSAVTATTESSWLTLTVSGANITAVATANDKLEGRSAKIVIKAGDGESIVTATQKGSVFGLVNGKEYTAVDEENTLNIPIVHSSTVTVESQNDWLQASFDAENSQIVINVASNEAVEAREGYVAFATGTVSDTLKITQRGMVFEFDREAVSFITNSADTAMVAVSTTRSVTVQSTVDWITASYGSQDGASYIYVDVAANAGAARIGYVVVSAGASQKVITVSQYDFAHEVYGNYLLVYYDANTFEPTTMEATLTADGLTFQYPATETVILPFTVPAATNMERGLVTLGPNGAFLGMYGRYYTYLRFAAYAQGIPTAGYDSTDPLFGVLTLEEEEAEDGSTVVSTYMDFVGWFGEDDNAINLWILAAFGAAEFTEANYAGPVDYLIAPYLVKIPSDAAASPAARRAAALKRVPAFVKKRGFDRLPARYSLPVLKK